MPFFSVIVPTYNRVQAVKAAIQSIQAQSFADFELIVVDDGSQDQTWDYLRSINSSIIALRQENQGPGAARNYGARKATGNYLVFHDSDDLLCPWALEVIHNAIIEHNSPSHLIGSAHEVDEGTNVDFSNLRDKSGFFAYSQDFLKAKPENRIWASCFAVVRNDCFSAAGGFDEVIFCHEDQDLSLRLCCNEGFVKIISPKTVCIFKTSDSLSRGSSDRVYEGISAVMQREKAGIYPGGKLRESERREYLCVNIRNQSLMLSRSGRQSLAARLYIQGFSWNLRNFRIRYLIGAPVLLTLDFLRYSLRRRR